MRQFVFQQKRKRQGKLTKSRIWYGEYKLDGDAKPTRLSLKTTDKRIAEKRLAEIVHQAERERANLVLPRTLVDAATKPVSDHIDDYLRDLRSTGRAKEYTRQVSARLRRLQAEIGWKILKDMTPESFIAWRDRQDISPTTKNHFHDAVRGFANWLVDRRRIEVNLFLSIKRTQIPKGSRGNHRSLSVDEVRRLIAAAPPHRGLVYLLAVTTGLRHVELKRLNWLDVRLEANPPHIYFPGESAKNKRPSTLVLTEEAVSQLRSIHPSALATGCVFF
ncbi:MAG: tyrosine-type recombinase/integrase [Phycisphaerales bacterium]|nr:tyrosine-type recombinase/integrase [Planctomycetota bacterium]MCH8508882.1 tyrosine-type recombinase/integrase [Phycisphaerales bacterium]